MFPLIIKLFFSIEKCRHKEGQGAYDFHRFFLNETLFFKNAFNLILNCCLLFNRVFFSILSEIKQNLEFFTILNILSLLTRSIIFNLL
jgi:hypothetical protein